MWDKVMSAAAESGIWAILFVVLFFIQIKDSKTRESNYQSTIDALAEKLKMIADIKSDIETIKNKLVNCFEEEYPLTDEKKKGDEDPEK